jgi:hypothetical protein
MKCEGGGCRQEAEFYDPTGNKLCSDCIQSDVETSGYTWDECEAIPRSATGYVSYEVNVTCPNCSGRLDLADFPYDQTDDDKLGMAVFGGVETPATWQGLHMRFKCNHCKADFILTDLCT